MGPYELVKVNGGAMAAGFTAFADPIAATDTLIGYYQLLPNRGTTPALADTVTGAWVAACSVKAALGCNKYIDLSSTAGSFLVWRWMSRSGSAVTEDGYAGLGFKENATYYRELK
jgi:hypothetical protein